MPRQACWLHPYESMAKKTKSKRAAKRVLILRGVDELSAPVVAGLVGLGIEGVKSRVARARAVVGERLRASGEWW